MLSRPENLSPILYVIDSLTPKSVCDIGCGFGKYGILIRELLLSKLAETVDLEPNPSEVRIDAWEGTQYFKEVWERQLAAIYESVTYDWATPDNYPRGYDLVLLIDVIEHIEKPKAVALLDCLTLANGALLISTPLEVIFYTKDYYGSDCPKHIAQWSEGDWEQIKSK